ncbi:MAG: type II secretion system GspH family protein [Betaproteobacteria bacterium]|nr:type II secretion system GspH family protein [Betaproteobacteria bacterium]MDH3436545.1 type II secretion system GspH family protein [Betaproteobacteria bacterium]
MLNLLQIVDNRAHSRAPPQEMLNQKNKPSTSALPLTPSAGRACTGFTVLELIIVIVITGLLAASAWPRFMELKEEAHRSSVAATAGAFRSAIGMANAACIASNFAGQDNLPSFGAGNVDFNANCFPSSTNGRNGNVNRNRCLQVWNGLLSPAPSISTAPTGTTDFRAQGGGTTCRYTYRKDAPTSRFFTYSTATGAIVVTNP